MNKIKDKRVLVLIGIILVIIIALVIFIVLKKDKKESIDTSKLDSEEVIKGQEEVTNLVKGYVEGISNINEYARNNSKIEFTIKELRGIFNVDTSAFSKLKYNCDENKTFIKYEQDYSDYSISIACEAFYLD